MFTRREFSLIAAGSAQIPRAGAVNFSLTELKSSPARAEAGPGADLSVERTWSGEFCRARVVNPGKAAARVRQVVLFDLPLTLPGETRLYGESFQMLSQTAGTLAAPVNLSYDELKHYRIPQPPGVTKACSGMLMLTPPGQATTLLGFTSSNRFAGRFYLRPATLEIVADTEGLELAPGEAFELEEFMAVQGPRASELKAALAARSQRNHPSLRGAKPPTGWCSWYCFGPRVTAQNVLENLDAIAGSFPGLRYVQLDDGYQPAMGDWLETGAAFGGDLRGVLSEIRKRGFEPAIWVAPFIAERASHLFGAHPDWFMKDAGGAPLPSDKVTFGGWRRGPWYALDGTHPGVQRHLEELFRTMCREWGCTYFKLDANFWGAMHGGRLSDPRATRIEAYRRGMQAVLRGAGDSFILGCNHPVWASFGLIHGSRSSGDISRKWKTIAAVARENLSRNWQNGTLWWNDPDAVVLSGDLPENEYQFHASAVYASGGMILSGDDLTRLPAPRAAMLRKLLPPTGVAAKFDDDSLETGTIDLGSRRIICQFNWGETARRLSAQWPLQSRVRDFWTGAAYKPALLEPHSARLLEIG
jgi:alpha-galactosidase